MFYVFSTYYYLRIISLSLKRIELRNLTEPEIYDRILFTLGEL